MAMNGWADARKSSLGHAIGLATRAVEIDAAMPVAYFVRGISYWELGEPEKALIEVEKTAEAFLPELQEKLVMQLEHCNIQK